MITLRGRDDTGGSAASWPPGRAACWSSAPGSPAPRSPRRVASLGLAVTVTERAATPLAGALGGDDRRRRRRACSASTASTCAAGSASPRWKATTQGMCAAPTWTTAPRSTSTWRWSRSAPSATPSGCESSGPRRGPARRRLRRRVPRVRHVRHRHRRHLRRGRRRPLSAPAVRLRVPGARALEQRDRAGRNRGAQHGARRIRATSLPARADVLVVPVRRRHQIGRGAVRSARKWSSCRDRPTSGASSPSTATAVARSPRSPSTRANGLSSTWTRSNGPRRSRRSTATWRSRDVAAGAARRLPRPGGADRRPHDRPHRPLADRAGVDAPACARGASMTEHDDRPPGLFAQILDYANRANPYPLYARAAQDAGLPRAERQLRRQHLSRDHGPDARPAGRRRRLRQRRRCARARVAVRAASSGWTPCARPAATPGHEPLRADRGGAARHAAHRDRPHRPACAASTQIDLVDDFAYPLPVTVICRQLGVPHEDEPRFHPWAEAIITQLDPRPGAAGRRRPGLGGDEPVHGRAGRAVPRRAGRRAAVRAGRGGTAVHRGRRGHRAGCC